MGETTRRIRASGGLARQVAVDGPARVTALCDGHLDLNLSRFPDVVRGVGDDLAIADGQRRNREAALLVEEGVTKLGSAAWPKLGDRPHAVGGLERPRSARPLPCPAIRHWHLRWQNSRGRTWSPRGAA